MMEAWLWGACAVFALRGNGAKRVQQGCLRFGVSRCGPAAAVVGGGY